MLMTSFTVHVSRATGHQGARVIAHRVQPLYKIETMLAGKLGLQVQVLAAPLPLFGFERRGQLLPVKLVQLGWKLIGWARGCRLHSFKPKSGSQGAGAAVEVLPTQQAHGTCTQLLLKLSAAAVIFIRTGPRKEANGPLHQEPP